VIRPGDYSGDVETRPGVPAKFKRGMTVIRWFDNSDLIEIMTMGRLRTVITWIGHHDPHNVTAWTVSNHNAHGMCRTGHSSAVHLLPAVKP
jgi:hypothetical protein